jgi:hypothetical protein
VNGKVTVYGLRFGAGKAITITFSQPPLTNSKFTMTAASDGSFSIVIGTPATAIPGQATITACDSSSCASAPITVQ